MSKQRSGGPEEPEPLCVIVRPQRRTEYLCNNAAGLVCLSVVCAVLTIFSFLFRICTAVFDLTVQCDQQTRNTAKHLFLIHYFIRPLIRFFSNFN